MKLCMNLGEIERFFEVICWWHVQSNIYYHKKSCVISRACSVAFYLTKYSIPQLPPFSLTHNSQIKIPQAFGDLHLSIMYSLYAAIRMPHLLIKNMADTV